MKNKERELTYLPCVGNPKLICRSKVKIFHRQIVAPEHEKAGKRESKTSGVLSFTNNHGASIEELLTIEPWWIYVMILIMSFKKKITIDI